MAAVNHIRNIRNQRKRDVFHDFVARCLDGGDSVNVDFVLQIFENTNNDFDAKEVEKLRSLGEHEHEKL